MYLQLWLKSGRSWRLHPGDELVDLLEIGGEKCSRYKFRRENLKIMIFKSELQVYWEISRLYYATPHAMFLCNEVFGISSVCVCLRVHLKVRCPGQH